jgi:hypothetical protein
MQLSFTDGFASDSRHQAAVRAWGGRRSTSSAYYVPKLPTVVEIHALRSLRLHPLRGERAGDWSMVLHDRWRLLVRFEESTVHVLEVSNHYGD